MTSERKIASGHLETPDGYSARSDLEKGGFRTEIS